jgi:methionyl-tRNA formyltransferase
MIVDVLDKLGRGPLPASPQPAFGVSYAHKLRKEDSIVDWSRPAHEIACLVRALRPAPGAVSMLGEEPLKIWDAEEVAGAGLPGQVLAVGDAGIQVACGSGALAIRRLQRAGGKTLDAAAFLRGRPIAIGERLNASAG